MASSDINLLQTKSTTSLFGKDVESLVRIIAILVLSITFAVGLLVAGAYVMLQSQKGTLDQTKNQFLQTISDNKEKESILTAINSRLSLIQKIMDSQHSYAPYIDTTLKILTPAYTLSSFSIGKDNAVNMTVDVNSVGDAMEMLTTIMKMEDAHMIKNPVLNSFSLEEGGKISVAVSYTVIL